VKLELAFVAEVAVSDHVNVNLRDFLHERLEEFQTVTLPGDDPERHELGA
jgi:hypothetical protein